MDQYDPHLVIFEWSFQFYHRKIYEEEKLQWKKIHIREEIFFSVFRMWFQDEVFFSKIKEISFFPRTAPTPSDTFVNDSVFVDQTKQHRKVSALIDPFVLHYEHLLVSIDKKLKLQNSIALFPYYREVGASIPFSYQIISEYGFCSVVCVMEYLWLIYFLPVQSYWYLIGEKKA